MTRQRQAGQSHALPQLHDLPSPHPEQHSQMTFTRQIDIPSGLLNTKMSIDAAKLLTFVGCLGPRNRPDNLSTLGTLSSVGIPCLWVGSHCSGFSSKTESETQLDRLVGIHRFSSGFRKYDGTVKARGKLARSKPRARAGGRREAGRGGDSCASRTSMLMPSTEYFSSETPTQSQQQACIMT